MPIQIGLKDCYPLLKYHHSVRYQLHFIERYYFLQTKQIVIHVTSPEHECHTIYLPRISFIIECLLQIYYHLNFNINHFSYKIIQVSQFTSYLKNILFIMTSSGVYYSLYIYMMRCWWYWKFDYFYFFLLGFLSWRSWSTKLENIHLFLW